MAKSNVMELPASSMRSPLYATAFTPSASFRMANPPLPPLNQLSG